MQFSTSSYCKAGLKFSMAYAFKQTTVAKIACVSVIFFLFWHKTHEKQLDSNITVSTLTLM